ncbi:hypothetical protein NBM05_07365 [Rothia sp. AR01]|uniref:Uncharacterized protein n=1 Tax=Rothia santali TaxID=2949643 RepID=A0A9X2KIG6_9MICC|nr:hypothetical protein [Rothia santali]MCP3425829.1 hypothetical protein [Rothia santali]
MIHGKTTCFLCQRPYRDGARFPVEIDESEQVFIDLRCHDAVTNLTRAQGISRWDAVVQLMDRIEAMLLGHPGERK